MTGWVYVITNKEIPKLVKIGYTTNNPEKRADSLISEGVPQDIFRESSQLTHKKIFSYRGSGLSIYPYSFKRSPKSTQKNTQKNYSSSRKKLSHPFTVEYAIYVESPYKLEKEIHNDLKKRRKGGEWFILSPEEAVVTIKLIVGNKYEKENYYKVDKNKVERMYWLKKAENILDKIYNEGLKKNQAIFQKQKSEFEKKKYELINIYENKKNEIIDKAKFNLSGGFFIGGVILSILLYEIAPNASFMAYVIVWIIAIVGTFKLQEILINEAKQSEEYKSIVSQQTQEINLIERENELKLKKLDEELQKIEEDYKFHKEFLHKEEALLVVCFFCKKKNKILIEKIDANAKCGSCYKDIKPEFFPF